MEGRCPFQYAAGLEVIGRTGEFLHALFHGERETLLFLQKLIMDARPVVLQLRVMGGIAVHDDFRNTGGEACGQVQLPAIAHSAADKPAQHIPLV